jgi:hypothetical protein
VNLVYLCPQDEAAVLAVTAGQWPEKWARTPLAVEILRTRLDAPETWLRRALRFRVRVR